MFLIDGLVEGSCRIKYCYYYYNMCLAKLWRQGGSKSV
jgi:hypothetical protein